MSDQNKRFSLKSLLWPYTKEEQRKILPMLGMLFFIGFNYSILKCLKDSIVVTASGAEVIPFIKVWVMLPAAFGMTFLFTKLTNRFSQERVFYLFTTGFITAFLLFGFVIYPLGDQLHPHTVADFMEGYLPLGFKGLISLFRYWTHTLFYVLSELWGIVIMTVLFWGFANEVTKVQEAPRFYGALGAAANLSSVFAGITANTLTQSVFIKKFLPFGSSWEETLMLFVSLVALSGLITMALYRFVCQNVLNTEEYESFHKSSFSPKKKKKLSITESFIYLSQSRYLQCIAILVVSYNFVINSVEVVWKDQLRLLYPQPSELFAYLNHLIAIVGLISTVASLFMGQIIGSIGWTRTALVTPISMLITSVGFFFCIIFREQLTEYPLLTLGFSPLAIAVFFGSAQNVLSRAAKHSVFDATKEMAFIPLDHDSKLKGKAAIDGVGSRLGKSGGSFIHQGLLMIFVTFSQSAPFMACIVILVIGLWITTTYILGQEFDLIAEGERKQKESTPIALQV
jgi:AAA family ATP:ADP antiporter